MAMEATTQENTVQQLAKACDIQLEWQDIWGNTHVVTEEMCKALLSAMEVTVNTLEEASQALDQVQHATVARWLEPVLVVPQSGSALSIPVRLPTALQNETFHWTLTLENGTRREGRFSVSELRHVNDVELALHHERIGVYALELETAGLPPSSLSQGYHQFVLRSEASHAEVDMLLVLTPDRCFLPEVVQSAPDGQLPKVWGPAVQLYAVHSKRNWGMGDFTDLVRLIDWCKAQGAGLVGLNPLHALFPHNPAHCSPYSPSSRMFFNILYLDPEALDDYAESAEARKLVLSPVFQEALEQLRAESEVPYVEVARRKMDVLNLLYQNFCRNHLAANTERAQAFNRYRKEHGRLLERFALFHALQDRFFQEDASVWGWPAWPEAFRSPESPAVQDYLKTNREHVGFYEYLQWQAELQLEAAGLRCLQNQLGIGLYLDMAVGVDRGGADVWANQHLFAQSSAVGAPPDEYNQKGQDWGLPPLIPQKMREEAYQSFIQILRQNMRIAGALRIDHVMGLMRLFLIPPGLPPSQGAYIHYAVDELFGILALESQRNQCMVIGEDMGTVPDAVRERMNQWGVYSYKVFYFEKENAECYKWPEHYQDTAAVAVSTHDLPTLSGFWEGRDIAVRRELDLFPSIELRDRQISDRVLERVAILRLLEQRHLLPEGVTTDPSSTPTMTPELSAAIHRLVAQTSSQVFMVQFEDMLQQVDQINLPGTTDPVYPCWKRKITLPLEELVTDERVNAICQAIAAERPVQAAHTTLADEAGKKKAHEAPP
jgi:(1->4)-alpha-D-glucan 1-alpha-D-glucosylmutase